MVEEKRDTVVVENDRNRSPVGWIIGVIVLVILVIWFFSTGGFGLFGGSTTTPQGGGDTTNIETPDTINVQPPAGQ